MRSARGEVTDQRVGMETKKDALSRHFGRFAPVLELRGGETLARAGQPLGALYKLEAGRIGELSPGAAGAGPGAGRLAVVHRPGAVIGGLEALRDGIHRSDLVALRDSRLRLLPIRKAESLLRRDAHVLAEVARGALRRVAGEDAQPPRGGSILGFVSVTERLFMRRFVEAIAQGALRLGVRTVVLGAEAQNLTAVELSRLEEEHDLVLLAAEFGERDFAAFCHRQIDRLILVGDLKAASLADPALVPAALSAHRLMDVILVHPPGSRAPSGAETWLGRLPASRLFHVHENAAASMDRLARIYCGRSVGLVLSGGGARAYSHAGVVRALRELGAPIDFVAGNSMGAIVAAGVAMGWDDEEMDARLHDAFVASSPLNDIAFPVLAMTHGREVEARLERHFGDVRIGDLWRPFACVSTDLTDGVAHVHRDGLLREALRASLSLPGVLPPVIRDGHVLVDGAMVDNLPVDLVKAWHDGPTIGVDVGHAEGLKPQDLELHPSPAAWLASGAWKHGPPIVSVLIRAATVGAEAAVRATHDALDLVLLPQLDSIGLQDWKAYAPAVDAGYRSVMDKAESVSALLSGRDRAPAYEG